MVVLSASFDPGWHATVDGVAATPVMVAPALVAVSVGPGTHTVAFDYVGAGFVAPLMVVSAVALVGAVVPGWRRRRKRPDAVSLP
jgi:uncharacterized membrane protein YfhO